MSWLRDLFRRPKPPEPELPEAFSGFRKVRVPTGFWTLTLDDAARRRRLTRLHTNHALKPVVEVALMKRKDEDDEE